ncbi:hypothetical protein ACIBKY_51400 [Nonomuraea sp. NPDC050394]|uniref:hypothetical protein n=1 Tax=Nonomuraea sp. NPDC050394 TaxID=3364363 RepID=UPI0037AEF54F
MPKDNRKLTRDTRALAAQEGVSYQQARATLLARTTTADPSAPTPARSAAVLTIGDLDELVRLVQADKQAAGITVTEDNAREHVAFTIAMLKRYLTSEPLPPAPATEDQPRIYGPHCPHDDDCATDVCQDGYAWHACHTPGCPICGAPPVSTPEHWAGDVVAHAIMSPADVARAEAHLRAFPQLRRPHDPPTISNERYYQATGGEAGYPCGECGGWVPDGYSCDCYGIDGED